jgi:phenolic acid decarboxylase
MRFSEKKKIARKQNGSGFLDPEVWTEQNKYMILMDKSDHRIDVIPVYPIHCHPYLQRVPYVRGRSLNPNDDLITAVGCGKFTQNQRKSRLSVRFYLFI